MWRLKHFAHQSGLEGRIIDVGHFKVHVRNIIAEGGFSCVYHAQDTDHCSKRYALKHMICNDDESLELALKEISVMKSLKGHPNIVTLYAHTILDMGRTKEALICMEYCEKTLVSALEGRGSGYLDEKQILMGFRDVCNALFAMHGQSPPIAHRDLKAENILLGPDGLWKLCDFGSTTTNHKRFEKPEEMGIEEDNIRKHTTPAYRAPEMWDLYRKEMINEKVDIWALGCLLFRICYFKSAFDGESKLQVLNGNYRIPELPKYSTPIVDLIRDMLQSSPDARPDITQVWFRANNLLPDALQKSLPDRAPEMLQQVADFHYGTPKTATKTNPVPRRAPPPVPPSAGETNRSSPQSHNPGMHGANGPLGAFWNSEHAKNVVPDDKTRPRYDEELSSYDQTSPSSSRVVNRARDAADSETIFSNGNSDQNDGRDKSFNAFVAEFSSNEHGSEGYTKKSGKEEVLEAEVEKLKEQLTHANMEKAEITSKYAKLSAICRSQRQEIQELKQVLAAKTPSPNKDASKNQTSPSNQTFSTTTHQGESIQGTIWELQQGLFNQSPSSPDDPKPWQAFSDDSSRKPPANPPSNMPRSMRTRDNTTTTATTTTTTTNNKRQQPINQKEASDASWGFGTDSFTALPSITSQMNSSSVMKGPTGNRSSSQPAGWAGF